MEYSPWMQPGFWITVGGLVIGTVIWLVRLESKANATAKRQEDYEKSNDERQTTATAEAKEARRTFYEHVANVKMHQNEAAEVEFRSNLEHRFSNFEKSLEDIGRKLNHLAGRE